MGESDFHYDKWENPDDAKFQSGTMGNSPFPDNRKGKLDYDLLKKMGLTRTRLENHDALFFWQLLFPICDHKKSGIPEDPRTPFYSKVEIWTTKYAVTQGLLGTYGHDFKPVVATELLHFDMAMIRDGVLGGQGGAIYRRWKKPDKKKGEKYNSAYDPEIAAAITYSRWLQIKQTYKLCDNDTSPKKGQRGYDPTYKNVRQIFSEKPHSTWDNHFSGNNIMDYLEQKGYAATMTCQRNRIPKGVHDSFLHKEKTVPRCQVARVARFNKPITLVTKKTCKGQLHVIPLPAGEASANIQPTDVTWTRVHVTFQSTSSTNISTVNALNVNQLFVRQKECGRGEGKRKWVIEMNEARQLYLASYGRIDTIDALIKKCKLYYCSWKYWHSCKLHVQALGLVVAYNMFSEVIKEGFAEFGFELKEAALECMLDFHEFQNCLSLQGLQYNPEDRKYKGDKQMRVNTRKRKGAAARKAVKRACAGRPRTKNRVLVVTPLQEQDDDDDEDVVPPAATKVSLAQLKAEKGARGRLCGNMCKFLLHKKSIQTTKHALVCRYCGKSCYS
jgi:hypothetical protein